MSGSTGIAATEANAAATGAPALIQPAAVPEGEVVILQLKPHPLFVVLSVLGPVTLCVVCALLLRWVSGRQVQLAGGPILELPNLGRLWMLPVAAAALAIGWQVLEWWMRVYLLTDRRIVRVSGVLRQTVVEVPLARVQQVMLYRSLRERVFGLGTPGVSSAGSGDLSFVFWNMVSRPVERQRVLRETIAKYGGNGHGGMGGGGCGGGGMAKGGA
jgi:uncharacterized membrane protein YdbT with pleckstrin-like domain